MSRTFAVYLRNFAPFFLLSLLVFAPWAVLKWFLELQPMRDGRFAGRGEAFEILARTWGLAAVQGVLGILLTGAITYGVVQQLRGSPAGLGDCVTMGMRNFGRVLGTGLLAGLRILIGYVLCTIPGIIETCRLFVAIPASVMEAKGATASIDRSMRLTDGSRWQLFGVLVVVNGVLWFVPYVVSIWATSSRGEDPLTSTWFFWLVVLLTPILQIATATAGSVAYFMLRKGKENVDVKELAAVFD
jgi:hypothetical protein